MKRPILNLHVDIDNLWIAEEEQGLQRSDMQSLVYEDAMPRFLDLFAEAGVRVTFFVVGRDLEEIPASRVFCQRAIDAGHRLGNHTHSHSLRPSRLEAEQKEFEVAETHRLLTLHSGVEPVGIRGSGYYIDAEFLEIAAKLGYTYDSSVLPGVGTTAMRLYFRLAGESAAEKTFGRAIYPLIGRRPQTIACGYQGGEIVELPIATMPFLRLPVHPTFVYQFGLRYLEAALWCLRRSKGPHVMVFHAIDLLDYPANGPLASRTIALKWSLERRLELARRILDEAKNFDVWTSEELVKSSAFQTSANARGFLQSHLASER